MRKFDTASLHEKNLLEYYKTVRDFHRIAEESRAEPMVEADLLLRHVDFHGLCVDVAGGTGYNAQLSHIPTEKLKLQLSDPENSKEFSMNARKSAESYLWGVITDRNLLAYQQGARMHQ
jgi:hypothetical protein